MSEEWRLADIEAIQGLDSRGRPTIMCRAVSQSQETAIAMVPSGASTGSREVVELRDGDEKVYLGAGVGRAVSHINDTIKAQILDLDIREQQQLDTRLLELDGSYNLANLGANAILGVSLAVAQLCARQMQRPLHAWLNELYGVEQLQSTLPVPWFNILNGGAHANNKLDIQEFMIIPLGVDSFSEALRAGAEVYTHLKKLLHNQNMSTAVGDEGGFAPAIESTRQALDLILQAIDTAGYSAGQDIYLGLDCAASEFYRKERYILSGEQLDLDAGAWSDWLAALVADYPICSIEDGMSENDRNGWYLLTQKLGRSVQLVGDDLFVTDPESLKEGARDGLGNSILIKPNQVGSLSSTLTTMRTARSLNLASVVSHRSGETEDTLIADLAVGTAAGQAKLGAPCRSERVAKYNRLLWIEHDCGFQYAGRSALRALGY
ncbi:MAG: phosphopyruvate hydratase [Gammaproteobacteria bacterium]